MVHNYLPLPILEPDSDDYGPRAGAQLRVRPRRGRQASIRSMPGSQYLLT